MFKSALQTFLSCFNIFLGGEDNRCTCCPNGCWIAACVAHDINCADSKCMKSKEMRLAADKQLRKDVESKGHPYVAFYMYIVARFFARIKGGY